MKNFYLFGKGELAIYCAERFITKFEKSNLTVIPTIPEPDWTSSLLEWSNAKNVKVLKFTEIENIYIEDDAIGISIYFDKIFKNNIIQKFQRLFNIHNSPLPKYRGVNPVNWALRNNENYHGVTLHLIDDGIDTGPIGDQILFDINQKMEVIDVYNMCIESGKKLIDKNLEYLNSIECRQQDENFASYYSKNDFINLGERKYFTRN